jgi:hypothetical protein
VADLNVAIRLSATDQASPVIGKVSKEVAGIGAAADTSSTKVGGLTSVLGKVGLAAMGIGAVATAVGGLGKALIDPIMAASDLDESMNKVQVVFGNSAKTVTDFAKTSAQGLGTSQSEALAAAGTFGNLFVSMGLGQKEAAGLSTRILTLGADLASFNNIAPEEALEKLRAGLVGEAEPLRALGVNLNEAAVEDEALRSGLAKSKKEITDSAKVQARYNLIMRQTKTAQGDFKNTSSGMANSLRIIRASFGDLQTEIGRRLLPVIAPLVSGFAKLLPQALDALGPVLDRVGGFAKGFADGLGRLVENVRTKGLLPALGELGREILPTLQQAFSTAGDLAGSLAAWLRDQVAKINWGAVWSAAKDVGAGIVGRLGEVTGQVTAWLGQQWAAIDFAAVWARATTMGTGLLDSGLSIWGSVTEWLGAQWAAVDWGAVWASVRGHGAALVGSLAPISTDIQTWLVAQWRGVGWRAVLAAAHVDTAVTDAVVAAFGRADATAIGTAIGTWLRRGVVYGLGFAAQDTAAWDRGVVGMLDALGRSLRSNEARRNQIVGQFVVDTVSAIALAFLNAPNWGAVGDAIRRKLAEVMASITPPVPSFAPPRPTAPGGGGGSVPAFQHGGAFRVGGAGGPDSQLVAFRASPGEVVAVGQPRAGRGDGAPITMNVSFGNVTVREEADIDRIADRVEQYMTRGLRAARNSGVRYPLGVAAGS